MRNPQNTLFSHRLWPQQKPRAKRFLSYETLPGPLGSMTEEQQGKSRQAAAAWDDSPPCCSPSPPIPRGRAPCGAASPPRLLPALQELTGAQPSSSTQRQTRREKREGRSWDSELAAGTERAEQLGTRHGEGNFPRRAEGHKARRLLHTHTTAGRTRTFRMSRAHV